MIDNLIGSLDFTTKLPLDIKTNQELPKFKDITPININSLLQEKVSEKPLTFDDIYKQVEQKNKTKNSLGSPYFISNYEIERFIKSDKDNNSFFDWKKNPIFKDPRYYDNEELNAKNQSGFRQFINGTSKAIPSALNAFVEGLNPIPGVKEDGEFAKWIKDWSKQLENSHPNFYTKDERDNPLALRNIADGNFWGDKVLKNAGFTVGAILSAIAWDAGITAMTAGSGTAPATAIAFGFAINNIAKKFTTAQKIIRGVEGTSMLGKATKASITAFEGAKAYSTGQKALTLAKLGYINYVGSNAEATIEGYEGLTSLNDQMINKFIEKNGRTPLAHEYISIKKIATEMANTRYAINLPLLMVTNAIEFGTLFSPSKILSTGGVGFGERIGVDAAGQLFQRGWKNFSKLEKVGRVLGSSPVKNFLAEGFQEGMQYSIEKATEDLAFKKFANPNFRVGLSEYMESQALGLQKTFSENEGLESMFIGGLTGLITSGGTSAWDKFVSKRTEKENKIIGENIDKYNELTKEGILNSEDFKEYISLAAERDQINFDGTLTHTILDAQMQQAIEDNNAFAFKALQHDKLFNLVSLSSKLGKVDAFKIKIDQLKDLSIDEFAQQMGLENLTDEQKEKLSENIDDYINVVKDKVDQMSEIIKTVNSSLLNTFDPQKEPIKFNAFNELKNTFAYQLSNIDDIKGRMSEEMDDILSNKVNPLSQNMINGLLGEDLNEESLILDDFTKNFVTETGFDLNILNNKYAKAYTAQLNDISTQISLLNTQIETAKAAKLPYSGYTSKLAEKKKELTNLTSFLTEFNSKINKFGEVLTLRKDFMHQESIDAYKDLISHVVKHEMNKDLKNPMSLSKADDLVNAIADLHLLNSSLKLFVDKNNKFQTPKGQAEYIAQYTKWKDYAQNKVQEAVRKSKYETLRRTPEESINQLASEIQANLTQVESINNQIEEIDKQLLDEKTTDEEKQLLEKRKDELLKQKQELLDQNKELEETKEVIEGKSKEDTQEQNTLNTTNNSESEIVERLSEIILPNLGENLFNNINEKINKTKQELQKVAQEIVTNNDLLIYLNNKLEFYLQKIKNEQKIIDKELNTLSKLNYSKNTKKAGFKKEKYEETIKKHKDLLLAAQDIQDRISEIEKTNAIQKQEVEDLAKKIQYYQSILNTDKTHTVELQQKLATAKTSLDKTNRLIEKTESYIDRLKSLLKEIVKAITNRIAMLNDFLTLQNKNTPEFTQNILKLQNNFKNEDALNKTDLFNEYINLEKDVNDVLDHEEINQELLDKAELLLKTQIEKAIKLQNEIRYLSELFQENLNEVKKENTNHSSPQNKKIVEEIKQEIIEKERPEVIAKEVKPIPTPVTIPTETIITQTPTPEVEEIPFFGTSRLMHSFYYKLANRTFGNVMIASFHNFLGKLRTFDGVAHKQNLESFLNQNNLQFTVLLAPDELYTPNGDYFDEAYKDKKAPIVALTDKEGNLVKVDKNNNLSDDGNYIVSLLPPVNKDATDLQDFNSTVEKVKNGEKVSVEVDASHAGHFNFLRQPKEFVLTPEILENPNVTLEIPNTKEAREVNGYTLMPGKLYLKIANNRNKSLMFLDVKLNKLNQISINGKSLPKTIYDSVLHIINNVDESLSYKQELDNFLNSILYVTAYKGSPKREPVIVQVNGDFYQFKIDTTSNEPSFTIEKNKEVIFELSNTKKDDVATLQNILKLFDLNDTEQGEIKIPILENGKLRFETQDYIDFLVQNANPTVRYELDFSMENPFDFTGGEIYFKTPSRVEEVFTATEITSNQSEIKAKKADIERRRQETNNKNEEFWEQFTSINAEEVADRGNLINKLTKDIKLPVNTRINNWVLEELNGKLWEGKNIRGKEEEYFGKENWDKIKEAKNQFDIEFKKIEDSNLAKIKLIEQKQSDLLSTIDGLELRKAWSFGLIEEPNVVGLDETNFISKKTEFKNGDLVETDNYEGYYYLSKPNKDDEWYEQIIGKTEQEVEDKINAKYDAELKAVESLLSKEQATSSKSEIEVQKADIEIGKVGNTEYEVKVDGVYYQGKKLNNPENKTHRQLIEADIERRKQEELNKLKENLENDLKEAEKEPDTAPKVKIKKADGSIDTNSIRQNSIETANSLYKYGVNKINAKINAELKALEQSTKPQVNETTPEISAKKVAVNKLTEKISNLKSRIKNFNYTIRSAKQNGFVDLNDYYSGIKGTEKNAVIKNLTYNNDRSTGYKYIVEKNIGYLTIQVNLGIEDTTHRPGNIFRVEFKIENTNEKEIKQLAEDIYSIFEDIKPVEKESASESIRYRKEVLSILQPFIQIGDVRSERSSSYSLLDLKNEFEDYIKDNAKLAALGEKEITIDEKTLEGFSTQEDLAKAFGTKPLEQSNDNSELTKEVVEPKIKPKKNFDFGNDESFLKSAKSLPIVQSLNVTNTDIEKVKAIFKGNVNIENLFQIANSDAWATFQQSAITLFKGATRADLFHEAWHHFSQLYLTKGEKVRLYEETRNKVKELKDKSDLEVEEYIAREFAKFTETGKIEGKFPERKSIFQKIMDFLKSIFSNETDLSLDSLFNNLYKGQINHLAYNTENIMFGKLNSGINDNFNYNDSKLILSGLDALFVQALESKDVSSSQLNEVNTNAVYNAVGKFINNQYQNEQNPIISDNLERVLENWNDIKKFHYKESVIFNKDRDSYEFDDDGDLVSKEENEDDKKGRNKADFQEASEKSIFDIMDKEVKSLIFTLVDKDKNGNEIVDPIFGLPKLVDFQRYVSIISEKLSNQNTFEEVEKILNELSKDYPSMKDLLNSLTINESNEVKHLRVQFIQNMALVKRELYVVLYNEESKTYNIKAAQSNKQNQVENDIKTYFVISPETKFIKKVNGENQITEPIVYENKDEGLDYDLPFIKSLGINLDVLDYLTEQQQIKFVKDFNIIFVVEHLNNYLKENGAIKDIFKAFKTKVNGKTQESAFKTLVDYNLTYLPENISSSFLNASGKIENENVMWATFDKDFNALQKAKTIQELIQNPNRRFYNPNNLDISSSKIMDLLFDQSGKRTKYKIAIQNYNGLASEKEGVDGKKTKEVFYTEKAIMDISQFMNRNILTTMQLSNKATYFGLGLPKKLIEGKYEFEQTMLSYLFDELNIIYQFDQKNPELIKLKKLSDSIGTKGKYNLAIFKDILTSNTQEIIDEYLETGNLSNETQDFVLSQINQFFEIDLKKTVDVLQDDLYKIVPSKSSSYFEAKNFKPEEVIKDYIQNQFVMNVELSKLVFGNPYMHKDPYKRIAGATSSKRRLLADKRTLEDFKSVTKETQRSSIMPILLERLKLKNYDLKNQRTSDDELRFIAFKDREKMSDSYANLLSVVTKELKKTKEGTPEHYSLLQKKIAIEKAYSNVNGSDAMGAITMDAWRKFNWLAGRWSTELEKIYQKTIKWDYHNRLLKVSKTEEEKTKQLALRNENTITDAEGLAISVMKYQYYGNIKNDSIMEKAFHKYQLMPLIPQLIEGKLWEQHLDRMILEDVDYALFDSADKLEKSKTLDAFYNNADLDNVNVLEDYESYYKEGNTSYNVRTGYLENIGEQVFMENGTDYSLLFGSQVRKSLFNTEDFSDLYDEFRNVIQQLTQIEKDNLFRDASLNENGEVINKADFVDFLMREIDKKVVNSNVKEYLRLTKAGEFAGSLDTNLQRQPIEQIVNSVLQNKIVKQKMHGEMMVQVSNVGFETFGKKDSLKFYELENGKVRKMEVKVPLSGKFKNLLNLTHSDGRRIETRERLNEMISKGLIDTRAITMIGYRIPTQEHNSIEVMQVQEFLDPISNLIVVPYEITAKAGSDFDIDKLNIFKPHIDENGNYLTKDMRDSITENLNKIQAEIDQLKVNKKISSTKQSNKYLEILSKAKLTSQEITEILEYRDSLSSEIGELYSELKSFSKLDNNNPMFSQFSKLGIIENNVETEKELLDKINLKIEEKRKQFSVLEKTIDQKSILDNELKTQSEKQKQKTLEYNNKIEPLYEQKYSIKKLLKSFDKFSYQNKILELFDKVLLAPNNFLNLVTPNSTFMFDEALNDVFKKRYKSNEYYEKNGKLMPNDIKYTKSLIPRYNWFTFKVLGEAGLGLGIAAVGNTFSQLIQKAKVNFTEEYLSNYNLRIPIGDISTRVLKDGQPKATAYSQLINLLVDVANDPRVGYANMGDSVIPIVNLMINFGTPIQDIVYFINQPIIVDYVSYISKNKKSVVDGEYQEDGFASYLKDKILDYKKTPLKLPEAVGEYLKLTAQELSEKLSDVEFNASKESMGYKLKEVSDMTEKVSQEQLLILAQFAQMEQIAKDFLQLQVTMNFDTSLVQDGFEAFQKLTLFKEIKDKNIFTNLDTLYNDTVISPLNALELILKVNESLFSILNEKMVYHFINNKLATEFANKGNKAKKKFVRTFKNDFIMYLFQNFMDRNPDAMLRFNITFASVLKTKEKDYTNRPIAFGNYLIKNLYKEFADIKNDPKYKDLFKQYLLLDRLFVSSEEEIKNIGLSYFNKDSQLQDTYIEQFKELLNNPDLEIRNFMLKFAYMSFYQSGLNKSFISSTDILPVPILSGMLENVREQYLKEFDTPIKKLNLLGDFYTLLKANNEFLRSGTIETIIDGEKIKEKAKNKKFNLTKLSSYRGKNFRTNIDNLLIQPVNIPIQQSEEEGLQDDSFIFEYKGKKINTEFLLSEDQSKALQDLIDFTKDNNESSIVLQGAAGTGKTSIIGYLQKYLNEQFLYTAPTHAATVELAFGTMKTGNTILPITVASSLKLNKDTNKYVLSKKASNKIGFGTIIVVDETSMLNTYDYKKLLDLKELGYKLIFIGDKKQIPEVSKAKNLDFKTISNAFTENKIINLDVIHRTSNENIKNILQKVRDSITFQLFKLKQNTKNVQFFKSDVSFKQKLKEFVLKDPQNTDYIGYTNKAVNSMNKLIREQIFGRKGEIQKEDIVMGYLGYQSKQIEKSDLANSISYKVENVEKTKNGYNLTLSSERLTELRKKGFNEIGEFSYTTLLPLSNKEAIENSFDQKVYDENNKELSTKFNTLYEYLQQAKKSNSGKDWVKYFNYHEGLSLYMAKNDLAADYIYNVYTNKFELYDKTEPSEEHQKLLSFYKTESNNFIVEKGIDFGHAITVHKSQGRTTKNVFFDANTIRKGDIKIMEKDKQISTENQSLGYVGLSRASENLFVNEGWVSFEEIDTVEESISQQTTKQPINKEIKPKIDSSNLNPRIKKAIDDIKILLEIGENPNELIDENIELDKNKIVFAPIEGKKTIEPEHISLPEKYRSKGLGVALYILKGEQAKEKGKILINSDGFKPEAAKVWVKLVGLGLATQAGEYATFQYTGLTGKELDYFKNNYKNKPTSIKRNLVELENRITDFEPKVQKLFNEPTIELYSEVIGNYEFDLSAEISDTARKDVESKLRDVKNSFTITQELTQEQPIVEETITPTTEVKSVQGENITSKGSEFAKKLTNVGNTIGLTYKGKKYVNSEHAYQTWKSGEFNQTGYDLKGGKVRGGKIGDTFSIMTDILTEKLKQHPELIQGINKRGGLAYIEQSTHNVIGDKFWESTGQNKFIEALVQAYKNINTEVNNNKVDLNKKRGDIIEFQQETYQVERVTKEGFDVRNINTGDVDFISTEDYINETQEQPIIEENNQEITKEDTDKLPPCIG